MEKSTEYETFQKLRRIDYDEMKKIYDNLAMGFSAMIALGYDATAFGNSVSYSPHDYRPKDLVMHEMRLTTLRENGWEFEDFVMETERRAILHEVELHNTNVKFPPSLLIRAKRFFPNMKFTEARIELE